MLGLSRLLEKPCYNSYPLAVTLEGDGTVLQKLVSTLVAFDAGFEVVPFNDEPIDADLYD